MRLRPDDLMVLAGGVGALVVAARVMRSGTAASVAALVIKSWATTTQPSDQEGTYVQVVGRRQGIWAFLMGLFGLGTTYELRVTSRNIVYRSGDIHRVIPLTSVSSLSHGFIRPWLTAIIVGIVVGGIVFTGMGGKDVGGMAAAVCLGVGAGFVWYLLNKTILIGVVETGGHQSALGFKRSVLDQQAVNEQGAAEVVAIIQHLIDTRRFK